MSVRQLERATSKRAPTLPPPDEQPITIRLAGAGSLRQELEALLASTPAGASAGAMRELILRDNVVRKSSASARLWAWKRLKLRYALDPDIAEHRAFVSGMSATADPQERGLLAFLMLARTDRLFRETTLECVSPNLLKHEVVIEAESIEVTMRRLAEASGLKWSVNALDSAHRHFLTALKDFGLLRGSRPKRTVRPRPGPQTTLFAARLSRLEGLTDLQLLDARWFRLLGLTSSQVINLLQTAARSGSSASACKPTWWS